jgi:hypothetical protein
MYTSLKHYLKDWRDIDNLQYEIALRLGVISIDQSFQTDVKWVFWTDNPLGNMLYDIISSLEESGFIEQNDILQYRWKGNNHVTTSIEIDNATSEIPL